MKPPEPISGPPARSSGLVSLPVELASDVLDELYELRGERNWWKDEPRCTYQHDYNRLCAKIDALEKLLGKRANSALCDGSEPPQTPKSKQT
jgi:hypothetical protein